MGKRLNLVGKVFERLTVVSDAGNNLRGDAVFECICKCGNTVIVRSSHLNSNKIKSCGCLQREVSSVFAKKLGNNNRKHGMSGSRIYSIWHKMKERCLNTKHKFWYCYGGRGISVCKEWSDSFESFHKFAIEQGYADNLEIDRIDNNRGYFQDNCRFVTHAENMRNRRKFV